MTTFVVSRRMPELAVRAALGAHPAALIWLVQREALLTTVTGLVLGLAGTMAVTQYLSSLLVNVSPLDAIVLTGSAGFLALLGAGAALVPALRAGRADPVRTLRAD